MKNYLLYLNCYTEDSINGCRYALLKYLSVYNLIPPANISVIVYTSRADPFEIFLSYFKTMQIMDAKNPKENDEKSIRQKIAASFEGNLVICQPYCYVKKPIEELFKKIEKEKALLMANKNDEPLSKTKPSETGHLNGQTSSLSVEACKRSQQPIVDPIYFVSFKKFKEINTLLKVFFKRNEEESIPNLVKRIHHLNMEVIEQQAADLEKLPVLKKWFNKITGHNSLLQRYQNKL